MLIERHEYDNGNHAVESTLYRNDGGVLSKTALTACSQTASRQTLDNAAALDVELFEVSAHVRARPEHEAWQGKIYTADELRTVCGLGEVDGLYGINCRHSYYPYIPGTKPLYSNGELDEMKDASVRYNGKEMTRYEAEQKLRGVERAVRKYKLQADVLGEIGEDNTAARIKIGQWQAQAREFCRQTGIRRDYAREYVGTGGGKQAAAVNAITLAHKAESAAKKLFPNETWTEKGKNVFAAESRTPKNKQQKKVFEKELATAKILSKNGHTTYLVPEIGTGKKFDAVVDGNKTELKYVAGNIKTLGGAYKYALKQGNDMFIQTKNKTPNEIYSKLIGETKVLLQNNADLQSKNIVYVWIDGDNRLYKWKMQDIMAKANLLIKK